jgi:glycosyltransferase involved in cell wall biosynthesis
MSEPATIMIVGNKFDFPHGTGAAAHVATFARGFVASGARVRVVSLLTPSSGDDGGNAWASGISDGVGFDYACGTRRRGSTFWRRRLLEAKVPVGLWRLASAFFRTGEGPKAIIAYTDSPWWIILMALVARRLGAKCLVEMTEIPFVNEPRGLLLVIWRWAQDHLAFKLVDGFVVMTSFLDEYVRKHCERDVPRLLVPIIVDIAAWDRVPDAPRCSSRPKVAYVGELRRPGETPDLIGAVAQVVPQHPGCILLLIGEAPPDFREEMLRLAGSLGMAGNLELAGGVPRDQLPALLAEVDVLALLRRDGTFSRAGFPTKLAEYLASGRPVVVTGTGDIPQYLDDGVSAYLSPPGDVDTFAAKLRHVLDHPEEAYEVGLRGRAVARESFDCSVHASRVIALLERMGP